jgi:hypothetical protein
LRVVISNEFGTRPVTIGSASVAVSAGGNKSGHAEDAEPLFHRAIAIGEKGLGIVRTSLWKRVRSFPGRGILWAETDAAISANRSPPSTILCQRAKHSGE